MIVLTSVAPLLGLTAVLAYAPRASASALPLEGMFRGQQAAYMRRAFRPSDWHPSQISYGDGDTRAAAASHAAQTRSVPAAAAANNASAGPTTVSPVDFGADPYGRRDSSAGFFAAIAALQLLCEPAAVSPDAAANHDTGKVPQDQEPPQQAKLDCGGAVLDLRGGVYTVSAPVRIPAGMGNLWVRGGTIVAAPSFHPTATEDPSHVESFVLIIGHNCTSEWRQKGACSVNVGVQQVTLDARHHAGGSLYVDHCQLATVGPGIMLLGFSTYGVTAFGSGGTIIQGVFAGEYPGDDPRAHSLPDLSGTAVALASPQHDGFVTNTIIWSAKVGVLTHGDAQQITGVHPWNYVADPADGHQSSAIDGVGLGIVVSGGGARIEDCYLDTVPLLVNMSGSKSVYIAGNLFLKNASIILSSPKWLRPDVHTGVSRLVITNNMLNCFHNPPAEVCPDSFVVLDETGSKFGAVTDSRVEGNSVAQGARYQGTRSRMKVAVNGSRSVQLNFSDSLLFPFAPIAHGSASCSLRDGSPVDFAVISGDPEVDRRTIRVDFGTAADGQRAWTGVVECTVDQSTASNCAL